MSIMSGGLEIAINCAQMMSYIEGKCGKQDVNNICKYLGIVPSFDHVCIAFVEQVFEKLLEKANCDERTP